MKAIIFGWREGVEEWKISHSHCKPVAFFFSSREANSKHSVFWSPDLLSPIPSKLCQLWGCFLASTSTCQLISHGGIFITCFNCSNQGENSRQATASFHSVSATSTFKSASWKGSLAHDLHQSKRCFSAGWCGVQCHLLGAQEGAA